MQIQKLMSYDYNFRKREDLFENLEFFFDTSSMHVRSPSYLVGIIFGFLIKTWEDESNEKKKTLGRFFFNSARLFIVLSLLLTSFMKGWVLNKTFGTIGNDIIEQVYRIASSTAEGLLIVGCHFDGFKTINKLLSLNLWKTITKISLSMYLISPLIQINITYYQPRQMDFGASRLVRKLYTKTI